MGAFTGVVFQVITSETSLDADKSLFFNLVWRNTHIEVADSLRLFFFCHSCGIDGDFEHLWVLEFKDRGELFLCEGAVLAKTLSFHIGVCVIV